MNPNRRSFLKQLGLGAGGVVWFSGAGQKTWAAASAGLPRSMPEAEGVSSAGISSFLAGIEAGKYELHSFMLVRHGHVVAEGWWSPFRPEFRHTLYSLSKSFTSTAVGLAVAEGKLRVDDHVGAFFQQDLPDPVSQNLAAVRVKDLLTMSFGHAADPTFEMVKTENWMKTILATPIPHLPGSAFLYNSSATYTLSAIVQKVTGQKVVDYLQPRLFEPLGIEGATWETCPRGINTGGWGLSVPTEALAKFAQMYRQNGLWNGRQLVPAKWIDEATTFKIQQPPPAKPPRPNDQNDWMQGYCYQFWRCRNRAYRGDGAFGQYAIVMPEQDAVLAITAECSDMQGELDLVWQHLLPAMKDAPLPADAASRDRLKQTLAALTLTPPKSRTDSPTAGRISGKSFKLDANDLGFESALLDFQPHGCTVTLRDAMTPHSVVCGLEFWTPNEAAIPGTPPRLVSGGAPAPGTKHKIAASATWKDDNTFEMTWRYVETPHHDTVTCKFDGDKIEIAFMSSLAKISPTPHDSRAPLRGKITA